MLKTPLVVVNFKTYMEAAGERAVKLAKIIADVGRENGVSVAVAPQAFDIYRIAKEVGIPVLAQHIDSFEPGKHTGWLLPEAAREAGAVGALVNHSEHSLQLSVIDLIVKRLRELKMMSLVCGRDVVASREVSALAPDMVAVEPPELIGTGRAVSKVKPEVVSDTVRGVHEVNPKVRVLCGAGIASGEDARLSLELGAEGVLLARAITCATDPRAAILDIVQGVAKFKKQRGR
jgi:triosephosphate isomerase